MAAELKLTDSSIDIVSTWNRRINSLIETLMEFEGRGLTVNKVTISYEFLMLLKTSSLHHFFCWRENKLFGYRFEIDYKLRNNDFFVS